MKPRKEIHREKNEEKVLGASCEEGFCKRNKEMLLNAAGKSTTMKSESTQLGFSN